VKQFIEIGDSIVGNSDVKIIDGRGTLMQNNRDLIFVKNKIRNIGATGKLAIPENVKLMDYKMNKPLVFLVFVMRRKIDAEYYR